MKTSLTGSDVQEVSQRTGEGSKRTFLAVERLLETLSSLDQPRAELVRSVEASLASLSSLASVSEQQPGDCDSRMLRKKYN